MNPARKLAKMRWSKTPKEERKAFMANINKSPEGTKAICPCGVEFEKMYKNKIYHSPLCQRQQAKLKKATSVIEM